MSSLPTLDVVIIGLNSAKTLKACIDSVKNSTYPQEKIRIIYADGGSSDGSRDLAATLGAQVVLVEAQTPTPGRQRNGGWQAGVGELVQFLDSDTLMDSRWLDKAVSALVGPVGAVCGDRRELYPEKSVFNWLGDQEWNGPAGPASAFGGDVLVRREALVKTGGYNPDLIAGEDPELAHRFTMAGYQILKLAEPMTLHDLAMYTLKQYWKRAYRSGHAYAEVNTLHKDFWAGEARRIFLRGGLFAASLGSLPVFALFWPWGLVMSLLGIAGFFRPRLMLTGRFQSTMGLTAPQARLYAWHASWVLLPQFCGLVRFHWGKMTRKPLTNRKVLKLAPRVPA